MAYYYPPTGSGTGDVVGPASATDNALVRYDTTTGKLVQNSTAILNDGTLSASSGTGVFLSLPFTASTTGTGGWTGLQVIATQTSDTGSGTKLLMQLGTGASNNLLTVTNTGVVTAALGFGVGDTATSSLPIATSTEANTVMQWRAINTSAGTGAAYQLSIRNTATDATHGINVRVNGTGFTTAGLLIQDGAAVLSGSSLSSGVVMGSQANAPYILATADTERGRFTGGGQFVLAPVALTQAAPTVIDFNLANERDITLTGDIEFTTSNLAAGRSVTVYITCDGTGRNFTFPAWVFVGTEPTAIAANKRAVLTLSARSTTDASVRAAYSVEA